MSASTNSLVATTKRLAVPAAAAATVLLAVSLALSHSTAHAATGASAPLDDSSVSSLVALDNAVEAVAARVTPAVVNVSVTSKGSHDDAEDNYGGQSSGGINPQDIPPQFRQFFGFDGPGGGHM